MTNSPGDGKYVKVTEHEGLLLSLIVREQPVTAYQLFRLIGESPVTSVNTSKGQLYPAIRRLKARDLVHAQKIAGDGRNSEELVVTDAGYRAVKEWALRIDDSHILLDDPLRSRVVSFDLLSRNQQLEWVVSAKSLVKRRREILEEFNRSVTLPYQEFAYRSASEALRIKMEWLDELLYAIAVPPSSP